MQYVVDAQCCVLQQLQMTVPIDTYLCAICLAVKQLTGPAATSIAMQQMILSWAWIWAQALPD